MRIFLWGKLEYNAWKVAAQYILDHETFDWHLNTGVNEAPLVQEIS